MNYWAIVKKVIEEAEIIIEVLDARFPDKTRNRELEKIAELKGKKIIRAVNKSDLISLRQAKKIKDKLENSVFVSAKGKKGVQRLKQKILSMSKGEKTTVAITGYPNTGKSSIINMLKRKASAKSSSTAGYTRGMQKVRISEKIMIIDTPGIIPMDEKDETLMVLLGAKNVQQVKDIEGTGIEAAEILINNEKEKIENYYGITAGDGEELLKKIAEKRRMLVSGGKPDLNKAATLLMRDYQQGKIILKSKQS